MSGVIRGDSAWQSQVNAAGADMAKIEARESAASLASQIRYAAAKALNLPRIDPVHPAVCALPEYRGAALEEVTPAGAERAMRNVTLIGGAK